MIKQGYNSVPTDVSESDNDAKFLSFMLGGETYAMSILQVREIIEYTEITPMPMMPDFIRGAINLRGHALPVIDLSIRLKNRETEITRRTCIVVVDIKVAAEVIHIGFIVDAVSRVLDFNEIDIERAPALGEKIRTDFIAGMGKINQEFVVILDIEKILMMDDIGSLVIGHDLSQDIDSANPNNSDSL